MALVNLGLVMAGDIDKMGKQQPTSTLRLLSITDREGDFTGDNDRYRTLPELFK